MTNESCLPKHFAYYGNRKPVVVVICGGLSLGLPGVGEIEKLQVIWLLASCLYYRVSLHKVSTSTMQWLSHVKEPVHQLQQLRISTCIYRWRIPT